MIARIIAGCARQPWLVVFIVSALSVVAARVARDVPLDAVPDLAEPQLIVVVEYEGRSPEVIEDTITAPLSSLLASAPGVRVVRGQSSFGLSFVTVVLLEGERERDARVVVQDAIARAHLPTTASVTVGPDGSGVGWVYQYALRAKDGALDDAVNLADLRRLQDTVIGPALRALPGVAEVAAVGGFERELVVHVDPVRLRAADVTLTDVVAAVRASTGDAGGHVLELGGQEAMIKSRSQAVHQDDVARAVVAVRSVGGSDAARRERMESADAMAEHGAQAPLRKPASERTLLAQGARVPVLIGDVADVSFAPAARRGIVDYNGAGEVVSGIVIARRGADVRAVIAAAKVRLSSITLPAGVEVVTAYDRAPLIDSALSTLRRALLEELAIVALVIALFLRRVRSALVPVIALPIAVLWSLVPLSLHGVTLNLMSLGGIAVAIGAMVDAAVVIVENVHKRLELEVGEEASGATPDRTRRLQLVLEAMQEVGPSIFFCLLILTVAFLPVIGLTGVEGRLFSPLALSKTWAMAAAAVLAITLTPALVVIVVMPAASVGAATIHREADHPLQRLLLAVYAPLVRRVVRARVLVVALALAVVAATVPVFFALESELMPALDEGTILYMPTSTPGMGVTQAQATLQRMDAALKSVPEVHSVLGKMGRADTATDPAPLSMAEITIQLVPRAQWRPGLTRDRLIQELEHAVATPGLPSLWWQPIQTRTEMLSTGVRSPVAAQLIGANLNDLAAAAVVIEGALAAVPGTKSASAERPGGGLFVDVTVRRDDAARLGVSVQAVHEVLELGIGGMPVAVATDGRARIPIAVRYGRELRDDPDDLEAALVTAEDGALVQVREVADVNVVTGPDMVKSEDGSLVVTVFVDTDRPVSSWLADAEAAVATLKLPTGVRLNFTGHIEHMRETRDRLQVVVPLALLAIVLLLFAATRSVAETAIIVCAVPFSMVGALWLLWLLDWHTSLAVWVGIIALLGLDAETGLVMLLYLKIAWRARSGDGARVLSPAELEDVIVEGAARRLRPKLMTVLCALCGLLPLLWSDGTGADVMKRVAAPMVGGVTTSFLLELLVYPALFALWKGRRF